MRCMLIFTIAVLLFIWGTHCASPADCWGCFGGPCNTSAACVEGCHCIQGTCG